MKSRIGDMYSGQAIAIVMVILVVAGILGASLYSRMLKNNEDVVDKQASDASLEQADNILNFITSEVDFPTLSNLSKGEVVPYTSISDFAEVVGLDTDNALEQIDTWCEEDISEEESASYLTITLGRTNPNQAIDVRVGSSRTFNFEDQSPPSGSALILNVSPVGSSEAVFTVKRIYQFPGGVRDYNEDDMDAYCVYTSGGCPDNTLYSPDSSVTEVALGDSINVSLLPTTLMVKVIPLKGDISVSYSLSPAGFADLSYVKINVAVNCYGSYREKEVVFPSVESLGYPTIFDYTIYNKGTLKPN